MADWNSLTVSPERNGDFMSLFTTKTSSPLYRMNGHFSELQFSPSPNKNFGNQQNGSAEFCSGDNMEQCVSFINQEVTAQGMSSLYGNNSEEFSVVKLVNCTHDLLQKHQRSSRIREELENRQHRTEVDIQNLHLSQNRLKTALEQNERTLATQQEKERQLVNKNKLLVSRLKMEKDEVKKLQSVIQHRDAQYKHEVKKKERELLKLKERIHLLLTDRTEKRIGLDMANPLTRSDGKRGTWKAGNKHEEEMYRSVISNYEDKQKELMVENTELRQCLREMQKELVDMLNTPDNSTIASNNNSSPENVRIEGSDITEDDEDVSETDQLSEAHFEMPYEFVRGDIEKSLKEKVRQVKQYIKKIENQKGNSSDNLVRTVEVQEEKNDKLNIPPPSTPTVVKDDRHKKEIDKLNKQIYRYREIIEQQETLLQQQLDGVQGSEESKESLNASGVWEEKEKLENEKKLFLEQKINFEEERKNFTEAAIRLARERKEFEAHKGSFLQNQFLQITPFRESTNSVLNNNNNSNDQSTSQHKLYHEEGHDISVAESETHPAHLTVATPVTTPSPDEFSDTPSTATSLAKRSVRGTGRRLLPATPSSTPAPAQQTNSSASTPNTSQAITTPRVMARPHSSIAIADGSNPDSVPSSTFAPRVLRPRSNAPSTAELYKKLGLEPPKERATERSGRQKGPRQLVYDSPATKTTTGIQESTEGDGGRPYDDRSHNRSYDEHTSSTSSRDRESLSSSHRDRYDRDKENIRNRSWDRGGGRDRSNERRGSGFSERSSREDWSKSNDYSGDMRKSLDTLPRERSMDRSENRSRSRRERSHDRDDKGPSHHQKIDREKTRQHHRPRTAREFRDISPERPSSRQRRERPKTARDKHMDDHFEENSKRKSISSKELDRQWQEYNKPTFQREGSFDYSEYSREKYRHDRENSRERARSRDHRYSLANNSSHDRPSSGNSYPWRRSSNNYSPSPLVLRNPERMDSSRSRDRDRKHSLSRSENY